MKPATPAIWLSLVVLASGSEKSALHPSDVWELTLESGYLWNEWDRDTPDYEIIPTQLTLRSPVVLTFWDNAEGGRLVVRNRLSLLMETFVRGPEDYYLGLAGAPSIEYWFPSQETSLFFSIGGGLGVTNSTDEPGGQGQDFTFNWFSQLGVRRAITEQLSILGSLYYLHHSNGGQTKPNPGIDAVGFTVGIGWKF